MSNQRQIDFNQRSQMISNDKEYEEQKLKSLLLLSLSLRSLHKEDLKVFEKEKFNQTKLIIFNEQQKNELKINIYFKW